MPNPTLYDNFTRVKNWAVEKFADKEQLAYSLSDVAFSGDYSDLINTPDLSTYVTKTELSGMSYATTAYVMDRVNEIIDGAPAALDTLNELAAAINDDANFASTVTTALGNKANSADVYTKTDIQNMGYISSIPAEYITESELSACGYISTIPSEYVTDSELSACGYTVPLTQSEMDTLFPITNS